LDQCKHRFKTSGFKPHQPVTDNRQTLLKMAFCSESRKVNYYSGETSVVENRAYGASQ
jgi:hypothetical protein